MLDQSHWGSRPARPLQELPCLPLAGGLAVHYLRVMRLGLMLMLAAGLAGVEENLDAGDEYRGNAYLDSSLPRLSTSLPSP